MNPRLRLLKKMGGFSIYEVDGGAIRSCAEGKNFTNFAHHYTLKAIPKDELWIDKGAKPEEIPVYIHHMMVEYRLMASGESYDDALDTADQSERAERAKRLVRKETKGAPPEQVKIKMVGTTPSGIEIWLVRGKVVRDLLFTDFTEGGHWLVYGFIGDHELWIDDDVQPRERALVVLHELFEIHRMQEGDTYDEAHEKALDFEWRARWALPDRPPFSKRAAEVQLCPVCGKASSMPCEGHGERMEIADADDAGARMRRRQMRQWIRKNVNDPHNHCFFYAAALAALFPNLTLVRGWNTGQFKEGVLVEQGDTGHFWVEDEDGYEVDPTADQYPGGENFGGAPVSLEANLDAVIKDPLFHDLSSDDQETIRNRATMPISGRNIGNRRYTAWMPLSKRTFPLSRRSDR